MTDHLLILGGTTEATGLAHVLHDAGMNATFSYAGRVARPKRQPLPTRIGGFGGVEGLAKYIVENAITHVVDATHPFAAQMSMNAVAACAQTNAQLLALTRPKWVAFGRLCAVPAASIPVARCGCPKWRSAIAKP